jgi:hypothetical protein
LTENSKENQSGLISLAQDSIEGVLDSLQVMSSLETEALIEMLIVLPFEVKTLENRHKFANLKATAWRKFIAYHLG